MGYFTLNAGTVHVQVYAITGQLMKDFKNDLTSVSQFDISDLNNGVYIVKAIDESGNENALKLIKK
jgi:hypothetical protein